ncbi:MAG: hypothetical protein ABH875_05195 [Candidatus Omnitrophota bacterium]
MRFIYKAKKGPEENVEGVIEAPTEDAAVAQLSGQGLVPVLVEKESDSLSRKGGSAAKPAFTGRGSTRRVSKKDIYSFLQSR